MFALSFFAEKRLLLENVDWRTFSRISTTWLTKDYLKINLECMENIIGLKALRENVDKFIEAAQRGQAFIVMRKSKPIFRLMPVQEDEKWEEVIDFSKIRKGGVNINEILSRI